MIESLEYLLAQARSESLPPDERVEAIAGAAGFLLRRYRELRTMRGYALSFGTKPGLEEENTFALLADLAAIVVHVKTQDSIGLRTRHTYGDVAYNNTPLARIRANAMFLEWAHEYAPPAKQDELAP